jgi:hypothetical protein
LARWEWSVEAITQLMKRHCATPWKKSRTYGDIHGGRDRRRLTDNIFARAHSLQVPTPGQPIPLLIQDNPSREFIFPVSAIDLSQALKTLPASHQQDITHIWLRRSPNQARRSPSPLAEFVCGSGVRAIIIYSWRSDGLRYLGRNKPQTKKLAPYVSFGGSVICQKGQWYIHFEASQLKRFYIEHLLCHEVGHHVDWYNRQWSHANSRKQEEFADQYAIQWGPNATVCLPVNDDG